MSWTPLHPRRQAPPVLGPVVILIVAAAARLYGIAYESLWLDEATSLMLARMPLATMIEWTALDIHPPLYYGLLHFWTMLGQSELVVRGLSALTGVLAVWVTYALGRELYDRQVGLFAAGLLALAPFHIWYSQEARMYACLTLFVSSAMLAALRFWRRARWGAWLGYVLAMAAALYTHYYGIFALGLTNLFWLYLVLRRREPKPAVWRWILAQLAVVALFAPWIPTFLLPITVGGGGWVAQGLGKPGPAVLAETFVLYIAGTGRALYPLLWRRAGYGLFAAALALGAWPWWRRATKLVDESHDGPLLSPPEASWLTACYLALPPLLAFAASLLFKPMYSSRYMLPFIVPFMLLVGRGVTRLPSRWLRGGILLALLVTLGFGVAVQAQQLEKPDWRGLAAQLRQQAQPDDLVLFMPGWHAKPFVYYAGEGIDVYADLPIPVPRYEAQVSAEMEQITQERQRIWLVLEEDHYTDPEAAVVTYLRQHWTEVAYRPLPPIGRVILFERADGQVSAHD